MSKRRARDALIRSYGWRDVRLCHVGTMTYAWTVGYTGRPIRFASWATHRVDAGEIVADTIQSRIWDMLKKSAGLGSKDKARPSLGDPTFQQQYPLLWSHLTQSAWEDGTKRQTSTMLVFCQEGVLKCMLRDVEAGQVLWTAGNGFSSLLHAVEGQLESPDADWREDRRPGTADTAKRVKRA